MRSDRRVPPGGATQCATHLARKLLAGLTLPAVHQRADPSELTLIEYATLPANLQPFADRAPSLHPPSNATERAAAPALSLSRQIYTGSARTPSSCLSGPSDPGLLSPASAIAAAGSVVLRSLSEPMMPRSNSRSEIL